MIPGSWFVSVKSSLGRLLICLDLLLHRGDSIRRVHIENDRIARKSLAEDLHSGHLCLDFRLFVRIAAFLYEES